ncbi:helix-turn-helix transcriptional regulator [Amorphus sp. 3PC139-8]
MQPLAAGSSRHKTWREAVDHEIEQLGWAGGVRVDEPAEDITIYVIDTVVPEARSFDPEGPATFSLSVFLDGAGTLSVHGARPFEIYPGAAVLFTSSKVASGENVLPAGQHFHVVDVRLEPELLVKVGAAPLARLGFDLFTEHSRPEDEVYLLGFPASAALVQLARDISACAMPNDIARKLYLHSKAIEALGLAISALQKPRSAAALRPAAREKVALARDLLETRFHEDWTIPSLARAVGINERLLKQGFRTLVGNSVHAYLRDVRLDAASCLLREGRSVTDVAFAVGFDSLSHFSKVFRAAKGVAPSKYARLADEG